MEEKNKNVLNKITLVSSFIVVGVILVNLIYQITKFIIANVNVFPTVNGIMSYSELFTITDLLIIIIIIFSLAFFVVSVIGLSMLVKKKNNDLMLVVFLMVLIESVSMFNVVIVNKTISIIIGLLLGLFAIFNIVILFMSNKKQKEENIKTCQG